MKNPRHTSRPDPKRYLFSVEDRTKYGSRFWQAPRRLVTDGLWARLWRGDGTKRGGGIATSILPVLALHTWPGKRNMDGADAGTEPEAGWTGWTYLSRRRIARLAGVDKDAATAAFRRLVDAGLMQTRRVPRAKYEGGYKTYYRLSAELYPRNGDDPYAQIRGVLFYGGTWSMLPTAGARHMYVVIACLDPIDDESAYLQKIADDMHGERWEETPGADEVWKTLEPQLPRGLADQHRYHAWVEAIKSELLSRRRKQHPVSLTELEHLTAMNRGTVTEALQVLTKPMFGNRLDSKTGAWTPPISLVVRGQTEPRRPAWYAPDRRSWSWHWVPDFLNDPARVDVERKGIWPELQHRRARVSTLMDRLVASPGQSAWGEARDLKNLRDRWTKARLPASPADLGRATQRSSSAVEQALRIAAELTLEVCREAGADDRMMDRLSRAALLRAARAGGASERARVLGEELRKASE